ncbi:5-bromo-4-chloroindolyl phosphate hydrolysis family protein [Heliorestis convoluta]|uniref:5-bromo-4-chloroindolyl phosphate hydrolysis protein, putative n=1 Tax=Heliorestis convoluta TaxID=356322 RepID=A0A5Q2N7H2_9FIRM|nr:5-bromo-4-chloroindolyl phosphate hydrolysis family protein [Heliorestis convoluta]QGG48435.1 5-bromo-4-chloroindolyl phosphate hydrolysis protein, putative [Heliorestis convoluta]
MEKIKQGIVAFFKHSISGTIGMAGFLFSLIAFELGVLLSLLSGALLYGGTLYALRVPARMALQAKNANPYGLEPAYVKQTLREGQQKLRQIGRLRRKIKGWFIRRKVNHIHRLGTEILDVLHKDPKRIKLARSFFTHYLDSTINILEKYIFLSSKPIHDAEIRAALRKTEDTLNRLREAYEKELAQILSDDVLDLDVELEVLKKSLHQEDPKKKP